MANETKKVAAAAIRGASITVARAEEKYQKALAAKGPQEPIGFADTKFCLPVFFALTGVEIKTLDQVRKVIDEAKSLLGIVPAEKQYLPYLGQALDAGIATLFAHEAIEALDFHFGSKKADALWLGAPADKIVKEHGGKLLKGTAPRFATLIGSAPSKETAAAIASELNKLNVYIFMSGSNDGQSFAEQLKEAGAELGWSNQLVAFGPEISSQVFTLGLLVRIAIMWGKINPGDYRRILSYCENNISGFYMVLNELDDEKHATAAGAISFGVLTMAQDYIQQLLPIHTLHRLR